MLLAITNFENATLDRRCGDFLGTISLTRE